MKQNEAVEKGCRRSQEFRQIFWVCAINDRETKGGKLIIYSLGEWKPVQFAKKRGKYGIALEI